MKNVLFYALLLSVVSSCTSSKDGADDNSITTQNEELSDSSSTLRINQKDLAHFFGLEEPDSSANQLMFFENKDSLIAWDENENDWIAPIRSISIGEFELDRATLVKQQNYSALVLDNLAEPSVAIFYKKNDEKVDRMVEDRHAPDSVLFHELSDTLLMCEYYWEYDFGSDLSDLRTYYFIGEQTGFFKYGCSTTDINLMPDNFVFAADDISDEDDSNELSFLVLPDTLSQQGKFKKSKKISIFELYFIRFENVAFSK